MLGTKRISTAWRNTVRRIRHRWSLSVAWNLRPHVPYQPLFVLGTGRSGSTLLVDYLRSLAGISCHGEVLHPTLPTGIRRGEKKPEKALRHIRRSLQELTTPIRGCKLMLYQLESCGLTVEDVRFVFPEARYVIIYRESLVEQYLSECAAVTTGQWTVRRGYKPKQARIKVDPSRLEFFAYCTRRHYNELFTHDWLSDESAVLSYEELAANPPACFAKHIAPLLGLGALQPQTQLVKQNALSIAERVENYDEVAEVLNRSAYLQHYAWPPSNDPHVARAA